MRISSSRRLSCSRLVDADTSSIYLFSCLLAIIATLLVSAISHIVLSPFSGLLLLGLGLAPILPAMAYVPFYFHLPSAPPIDSQAASDRLAPAIRARYVLRTRQSGIVFLLGWNCVIQGGASMVLRLWGKLVLVSWQRHLRVTIVPLGSLFLLLALMPTDHTAIAATAIVCAVVACAGAAIEGRVAFLWLTPSNLTSQANLTNLAGLPIQSDASAEVLDRHHPMTGVAYLCMAIFSLFLFLPPLQLFCKDTPPRVSLMRLWRSYRLFVGINGLLIAVTYLCITPRELSDPVALNLGLSCLLTVALSDERLRAYSRRVLGRLSFAKHATARETSAVIAALLGGSHAARAVATAEDSFKVIPVSLVTRQDLGMEEEPPAATSTEGVQIGVHLMQGGARPPNTKRALEAAGFRVTPRPEMAGRSRAARFGECDAFVSHSHRDDAGMKLETLHAWDRESCEGHANVWLDLVCLEQTDLDESLLMLPLFVSGCRSFLILGGPTYSSRLWCAIELFAFIQMGGTADRIVIRLIAEDPVIATRMLSFSVDTAECSFDSDRQMLLAVIESCFGQLSAFDKQMRRLVQERVV